MYIVYHPTLKCARVAPKSFSNNIIKSLMPSYSYMIVSGTIDPNDD